MLIISTHKGRWMMPSMRSSNRKPVTINLTPGQLTTKPGRNTNLTRLRKKADESNIEKSKPGCSGFFYGWRIISNSVAPHLQFTLVKPKGCRAINVYAGLSRKRGRRKIVFYCWHEYLGAAFVIHALRNASPVVASVSVTARVGLSFVNVLET